MDGKIQELLKQANSSENGDTSVNFAKRTFKTELECSEYFKATKTRLLQIEEWDRNSTPSSYMLFDGSGSEIRGRLISVGDFIRIDLHGSGKYDWVEVISIYDTPEEFIITVKPAHDPTADNPDKAVTSHFFVATARNNFCLQKVGHTVTIYVIGVGEKQNTESTSGVIESVRNAATANLGYYLGIQKATWTEFCSNFLSDVLGSND